jgi:hypothetical protein
MNQETKAKYIKWIDWAIKGAIGFLAVWGFNTLWGLSKDVSVLKDKQNVDKIQWEVIRSNDKKFTDIQIKSEVNKKIIEWMLDNKKPETERVKIPSINPILPQISVEIPKEDTKKKEAKKIIDKIDKSQEQITIDQYIEQKTIEVQKKK